MVEYNPFSEEIMADPYPIYRQLRAEAPVYRLADYPCWALSRFEDVWNASMDAKSYSVAQGTTPAQQLTKVQPVTPMINNLDPPDHTRLRSQFRPFFGPARVRALDPTIRELFSKALDELVERGGGDLVGEFGTRVATKVASIVAGIPLEDGEMLYELVKRFFGREEGVDGMTEDGIAAMMEMFAYFGELTRKRRAQGTNGADPLDVLIEFEQDGRPLVDDEIASHMSMLLIGGSETFPKVFANLARRLAEFPEQRAKVAADPSLAPDAFTEGLRYDMPTQFLGRTLLRDVEIRDQKLREGESVIFLYASANRDEAEFDDPDRFDIERRPPRILSFGHGTHACLGIHVAKAEGRIALEELLERDPEYGIDLDGAERLRTEFVQGFASLPIQLLR
ncbi:MAG: cytochrome P450 [Myxococcota bacterium]